MTEAEKLLWSKLRCRQLKGLQVYRQRIIGNYIADFYCSKASLIIELDGGQHYSAEGMQRDAVRDGYLKSQGYTVGFQTGKSLRILKELLIGYVEICNPPLSPFRKGGGFGC